MAPAADSSYFPPLDRCLAGDARLVSWRTAYRALCDETTALDNNHLESFFSDAESIVALSQPLRPFSKPSPKGAADFDTKTAPINVAQTPSGDYNLEELKKDAKWLSSEVNVDELAALRIAIIEWQERPADQLILATSKSVNTPGYSGDLALARSSFDGAEAPNETLSSSGLDFTKEDVRRRRLVTVYLSEKSHLVRLSADLVSRSATSKTQLQTHAVGSLRGNLKRSWIDEVAAKVNNAMRQSPTGQEQLDVCEECIKSADRILNQTRDQSKWPNIFTNDQTKAQNYVSSQVAELTNIFRLLLANLYSLDGVPGSRTVKAWFQVMAACNFLQEESPYFPGSEMAQLLIAVISVEILKPQLVMNEIMASAGIETPRLNGKSFIQDDDCVASLNVIFKEAATLRLRIAGPAIYAWSIITSIIRDIVAIHRDVREGRIEGSNPAIDGMVETSRRGSRGYASGFESLYHEKIVLSDWEAQPNGTPGTFAARAVDEMQIFGLIPVLCAAANTFYGSSIDGDTAFICKETLLDLMREGMPFVKYDAPVLDAVLAILAPFDLNPVSRQHTAVLAGKLLNDSDQFRPALIQPALARYPYELSPLLRLFTTLAHAGGLDEAAKASEVMQMLDTIPSYTQMVLPDFADYQLVNEDHNENEMILTRRLPIFASKSTLVPYTRNAFQIAPSVQQQEVFLVPERTTGRIVKESIPRVLTLEHQHSGLQYLALLLSTFVASSELVPYAPNAELDRYTAAEIVSLFTALFGATLRTQDALEQAKDFLGRLSSSLRDDQDIVTIIADLLEVELLAHLDQAAAEGSLELAIACLEFFNTLVRVFPERVWSLLARSSLLGATDGAASLASVVGGAEVQIGQYRFLRECVTLHTSLLDDAIAGVVKRKAQPSRAATRFSSNANSTNSTPERTMSTVLRAYQQILLDVFQSMPDWKFDIVAERCHITIEVLKSFTKLLKSTYGVSVAKEPSKRLTNVLLPAADSLLAVFTPETGVSELIGTFHRVLPEGLLVAEDSQPTQVQALLVEQTRAGFEFLTLVVRAANAGVGLLTDKDNTEPKPPGNVAENAARKRALAISSELLRDMPIFASLLACEHAFKADLVCLLSELVHTVGLAEDDPPSILAALELQAQKSFLTIVTQLDRPLCDVYVERRVWDFLSTIMGSKQQWFALYLLTGELPKKRATRRKSESIKGKPLLCYALDQLSAISLVPPERAIGMLKFIATAQQTWIWATNTVRAHTDFFKNTLAWMDALEASPKDPAPSASIIRAKESEMASLLCDILALNVHASMETGDKTVLKMLIPKLSFLREHGVVVDAYNRSLHKMLADNLTRQFPDCELSDFERTEVNPASYGPEFFYDRQFAKTVLSHDVSWHGANPLRNQGFSDEFSRANANLSLLWGQTRLLKSWKVLATTLSECADQDSELQIELAKVAKRCLTANTKPQFFEPVEPGLADVLSLRTQLAFVLASKLVALKVRHGAMNELLPAAWALARSSPIDYDVATAPEDIRYYRELLQVLYLTIQPHIYLRVTSQRSADQMEYLAPATASILVEVVGKVVGPGFRALCSNLHSDMELALPADFALVTALLQAILSVPGISSVYILLSDLVAGSSIVRGALSLYSWADRLAEATEQDPVYGEIAVMFLLALSTVRPIAESMALDGVLTNLASGQLSNYFRKPGGKGPFDEPGRMFVIWSEGLLPLCLNLLDSVGPPVAIEVAAFLNSFSEQLHRAEQSLRNETPSVRNLNAGAVTLGLMSEAHSLTMIALILKSDMARGAAEGINAADMPELEYNFEFVKSYVEALSRSRRSLRDRITAVSPLEERWLKTPVTGAEDNLLVQKVLKEMHSMTQTFGDSAS